MGYGRVLGCGIIRICMDKIKDIFCAPGVHIPISHYFATAPKTMEMSIHYGGRGSVRKAPSERMVLFSTEYVGAGALDGPLPESDALH